MLYHSFCSALGWILNIPSAALGLTLLAWGNSIGDYFSDMSIALAGKPEMAVTGTIAGPCFNMLLGKLNNGCCYQLLPLDEYENIIIAVDIHDSFINELLCFF